MRKYRAHIYRGEVLVGGNSSRRLPATWQGRYKKGSGRWQVESGKWQEKGQSTQDQGGGQTHLPKWQRCHPSPVGLARTCVCVAIWA